MLLSDGSRSLRRCPWFTGSFAEIGCSHSYLSRPVCWAGGIMFALGRSLWPRMFFHLFAFAAIAASALMLTAGNRFAARFPGLPRAWRSFPACLLCLVFVGTLPAVYRHPKQDYTGARDFVRRNLGPSDRVAALHMAGRVYSLYYAPEWREISTIEELEAARSDRARTWVVYTLPSYITSAHPKLARMLQTDYKLVRSFPGTLRDGEILVLRGERRD